MVLLVDEAQVQSRCRWDVVGSPPRGIPLMVDWSVEVHVIRNWMVTETQDLYRSRSLVWRKTLRHVFCYFVLIGYEIWSGIDPSTRGPLPLLIWYYTEGTGLQVRYPIWYYTMSSTTCSSRCTLNSVVDHKSSSCGLSHLRWRGPWASMRVYESIPLQVVPEHLVSTWWRRLDQVRAV
jgi:hypothetical protein